MGFGLGFGLGQKYFGKIYLPLPRMFWAPVGPSPRCRVQSPPAYLAGPCFKNEVGTIRCHLNLHDLCVLNSLSEADPRAPKRSKKPSAFNPTVPSQTGPKGPEGALGPWPLAPGPLVPWPFGPVVLCSWRQSKERQCDGATMRRSVFIRKDFIGSAGMRASVNNW